MLIKSTRCIQEIFFFPEQCIAQENEFRTTIEGSKKLREESKQLTVELESMSSELEAARVDTTRLTDEISEATKLREENERLVFELKQKIETLEKDGQLKEGRITSKLTFKN